MTVFLVSFAASAALYAAAVGLLRRAQNAAASETSARADIFCAGGLFGMAPVIAFELSTAPVASVGPSADDVAGPLFWATGMSLFVFAGICSVQLFKRYRLNPLTLVAAALVYALLAVAGIAAILAAQFDDIRNAVTLAAIGAAPVSFLLHWLVFAAPSRLAGALGAGLVLAGLSAAAASALGGESSSFVEAQTVKWLGVWACLMLAAMRFPRRRGETALQQKTFSIEDLPAGVMAYALDDEGFVQAATPAAKTFFRIEPSLPEGRKAPLLTPLTCDEEESLHSDKAGTPCAFVDRAGVRRYVRLHESRTGAEKAKGFRLMVAEPMNDAVEKERQWRRFDKRMTSMIDANDDMVLFVSASGLVSDINRCALRFLKKARMDCVGDYVWNLFPGTQKTSAAAAWRALLDQAGGEEAVKSQAVLTPGEGRPRLFMLTIAQIENDDAEREFLCLGRDITDVTQARKSFQEAQARLEQTIAERTRELQGAKKAADEANLSKSRFLANMSHELRTPLNAILGYTDLMLQDLSDDGKQESQEYKDLGRVVANARNLLNLINDILDLSKVEANKMTLSYSDVTVGALVEDIRAGADPLMAKHGNVFTVDAPEDMTSIAIDRQKVSQCLLNLLSNAAKFTKGGAISLKIWMSEDDGAPMVYFEVRDTGKGMTAQQCEAIFDEFVQVEDSDQQTSGGTGLGLPITRRFCQLMGGDIVAASTPGAGSRFTMWVRNGMTEETRAAEDAA